MDEHVCIGNNEESGACFSEDRTHRFSLHRKWDERKPVAFLLLNPSIALDLERMSKDFTLIL